jgi:creatinine amidohydrolase
VRGSSFVGCAGVRRKTLHRAINELFANWEDDGVQEFVTLTAHRYEPHLEALLMALTGRAANSVYDLYQIDVSDILEADPEREHAGELETSLMLHLAPQRVRKDQARDFFPSDQAIRRYTRGRVPAPPPESGGVVGFPSRASAEKGEAIFGRWVEALVAALSPVGSRSNRAATDG